MKAKIRQGFELAQTQSLIWLRFGASWPQWFILVISKQKFNKRSFLFFIVYVGEGKDSLQNLRWLIALFGTQLHICDGFYEDYKQLQLLRANKTCKCGLINLDPCFKGKMGFEECLGYVMMVGDDVFGVGVKETRDYRWVEDNYRNIVVLESSKEGLLLFYEFCRGISINFHPNTSGINFISTFSCHQTLQLLLKKSQVPTPTPNPQAIPFLSFPASILPFQFKYYNSETQMAQEQGGAPYQFTPNGGKTGNSSRDYTGLGHAFYPNNDQYFGAYVNGQRQGDGKYLYANGDRYEGSFVANKKHGIGRFASKDKGEYYGYWENGVKHGEGTYAYANKDIYAGWWMFGKKHGSGTYIYNETGNKLVGEWADNQFVKGKWIFPDNGTYYQGSFTNNKPNGQGVWNFANGNTAAGTYKQTIIPNQDPEDKKINLKLDYQSNVGISESAWQVNAHEIF